MKDEAVIRSFFTTGEIPSISEKVLAWRDVAGFIFDVNPLAPPADNPFHAQVESYNFGSLVTSICDSVASSWSRTPLDAARNGVDHFLVQIYLKGHCRFTGDAADSLCEAGDILILDASRTTRSLTSDFRNFTLWVPRGMLEPLLPDPDALHGRVMKGSEPVTAILRGYLMSLHEQAGGMTVLQGGNMVQPTLELLVSSFDSSPDTREELKGTINAATLVAVKRFIREHLDSPALSTDLIARAVNVSRATLYRICEPLGGVQQYVRQQRLRKVLQNLADPHLSHLTIAQIAAFWGFEETSSFNRMFRREFGLTPGVARNSPPASVLSRSRQTQIEQRFGDRYFADWLTSLAA